MVDSVFGEGGDTSNVAQYNQLTVGTLREMMNDTRLDDFLDIPIVGFFYPIKGRTDLNLKLEVIETSVIQDAKTDEVSMAIAMALPAEQQERFNAFAAMGGLPL